MAVCIYVDVVACGGAEGSDKLVGMESKMIQLTAAPRAALFPPFRLMSRTTFDWGRISQDPSDLIIEMAMPVHSQEDLPYEEEIIRNRYSVKAWWRYLKARSDAPVEKRHTLYERALRAIPGSYKLWHAYLKEKVEGVRGLSLSNPKYEALNNTFERALVTMHKMPGIWIMYLLTLTEQKLVTRTKRTFDRALCSLAVTQHERIWEIYLNFVSLYGVPVETSLRVYRRFLKFHPTHVESFCRV